MKKGAQVKFILFLLALSQTGCATWYGAAGSGDEAWIAENRGAASKLFYCKANKGSDGKPAPICYEPKFVERSGSYDKP